MPIYTYSCNECSAVLEKQQSFSDAPLTTCEQCGGALRKIIHPVGIVFKGSGWYVTDYGRNSSSTPNAAKSDAPKDASSTESGSKDSSARDGGSKDSGSASASASGAPVSTKD